jgi:hypothetical protein
MARRGCDAPHVGRSVWLSALVAVLTNAAILGACTGTTGLVLGEVPGGDAATVNTLTGTTTDAAEAGDASDEVGCPICPDPIALSGLSLTAQQGGPGGTAYTDTCPGSQAVIGYQGYITPPSVGLTLVGGIQALCAEIFLSATGVESIPGATLPVRGTSQNGPWMQVCPAGEVVVGFSGHSGDFLDRVAFVCAQLGTSDGEGGEEILSIEGETTLPFAGGDGGTPYAVTCPPGQIARGSNLFAGEWVNLFGLVCGTPALVPEGDP